MFELTEHGVMLRETAPGIHPERDVVHQMGFVPLLPDQPVPMAAELFRPGRMGLHR